MKVETLNSNDSYELGMLEVSIAARHFNMRLNGRLCYAALNPIRWLEVCWWQPIFLDFQFLKC
jgi:hypothetical protein